MSADYVGTALEYAQAVVKGKIVACKWVKLACKRHLDDLKASRRKDFAYYFDENAANKVCTFLSLMPHTKGKWARKRELIELQPWQCFAFTTLFGWKIKKNDRRRYRRAYFAVPRKNGKSIIGSGIGLYMFSVDGEFGAEVYSGATTEAQAWEVFRPAKQMLERTPELQEALGAEVWAKSLLVPADGSRFEPVIGKPGDGASPSCAIVDEYHEHDSSDLVDTMETGMGAREQPLLLMITTAGFNIAGPCYDQEVEAKKVLEGVLDDPELFALIYTIDGESTETFRSLQALQQLDTICTCGKHVQTILIERYLREACANGVTTSNDEITLHDGANGIQIDPSGREECAALATNNGSSTVTLSARSEASQSVASGLNLTRSESQKPVGDGERSPARKSRSSTTRGSLNTALVEKSSTEGCKRKAGSAPSAMSRTKLYAWITATLREQFGESSADNVTVQSAFSEIVRRAYNEHSNTCGARKAVLNLDGSVSVVTSADDWTKPEALRKANPNFGISVDEDFLLSQQRQATQSASKQVRFKTKHLNIWCSAKSAWLNMLEWAKCADLSLRREQFKGERCYLTLDLASRSDVCVLMLVFVREIEGKQHFYLFGDYYLPEAAIEGAEKNANAYRKWVIEGFLQQHDGAEIDFDLIEEDMLALVAEYGPDEVVFDPYRAAQLEQRLTKNGITAVELGQTVKNLSLPMKEFESAIKAGRVHHDGNPMLTWMMSNVVAKLDAKDNIYPRKEKPEQKIDGAVASIMGIARAISGEHETTSFWES